MRYSDGAILDGYRHKFGAVELRNLVVFLESAHAVVPVRESGRDPRNVILRHDVHHNLDHAVAFAEWEASRGYRASYYVLPTAWYWPEPSTVPNLRRLAELGHEVGLHQDCVAEAYRQGYTSGVDGSALPAGNCRRAAEILREQLAMLSEQVPVYGTSTHGTELWRQHGVTNAFLWAAGYTAADFGLEYADAYHLHVRNVYCSDNNAAPVPLRVAGLETHILTHWAQWSLAALEARAA
jgi:hypothetical protein